MKSLYNVVIGAVPMCCVTEGIQLFSEGRDQYSRERTCREMVASLVRCEVTVKAEI